MRNRTGVQWPERGDVVYLHLQTQVMWRWLGIIVGGAVLLISAARQAYSAQWPLICLLCGVALFNGLQALLISSRRLPLSQRYLGVAGDILAISVAVFYTEGVQSPFYVLYALAILQQPLIMSLREIVSLSFCACVMYLGALISHGDLIGPNVDPVIWATVSFRLCFLFLTALIAERALKRTLSEYLRSEAIFEGAAEGILVLDRDRRIQKANKAAERLLGLSREEMVGRSCQEALDGEFCQQGCPLTVAMEKGGSVANLEETIAPQDRPRFPARVSTAVLVDAEGKTAGASLAFQDISEARAHEEARRDFVAAVVHELRSPLGAMASLAEVLSQGHLESEVTQEYANAIRMETRRALTMIDRLRRLTKLERDEVTVTLEPRDLRTLCAEASALVQSEAEQRGVQIAQTRTHRPVQAIVDRDLALQVLVDLLDNAIRYSHPGGKIAVEVSGEERPTVGILDHGIGISEEDLPFVFEKFYRGDRAKEKDPSGSGLGLALVRRMCDLMGAQVSAESSGAGGSVFRVVFKAPVGTRHWALPV